MGAKKPSFRTLDTGERAIHYPSGEVHLLPTNTLAERLGGKQEELESAHGDLQQQMLKDVTAKQEAMSGGVQSVPVDKRSC